MNDTTNTTRRRRTRRLAITAVAGTLSLAGVWAGVVAAQVDTTGMEIAINDGTSNT